MKNSWMIAGAVLLMSAQGLAYEQKAEVQSPEEKEVAISISDAYVPSGFDSGSDAYAIVNGLFPNTCYSWKKAVVTHSSATLHEVQSIATLREGVCLMMLVPFNEEVQLGRLDRGDHTLRFLNGDGTYLEKKMHVE